MDVGRWGECSQVTENAECVPALQRSAISIEKPMAKSSHSSGVLCAAIPHTALLEQKRRGPTDATFTVRQCCSSGAKRTFLASSGQAMNGFPTTNGKPCLPRRDINALFFLAGTSRVRLPDRRADRGHYGRCGVVCHTSRCSLSRVGVRRFERPSGL